MRIAADPFEVAVSPRLVLASSSPRRRELLHRAGLAFELGAANGLAEIESDQLSASELALLNALRKARAAAQLRGHRPGELRSEEHTSELQSLRHLVCRLLL